MSSRPGVALAAVLLACTASVPTLAIADDEPITWFEIFKLAPGRQEAFVRSIALEDEVSKAGGQPPTKLFFHQNGADWDVLLMKPSGPDTTPEQDAAMAAKRKELGLPSGPAYFVAIRQDIASHTDTKTMGPVSAAEWLAILDKWRAEHPAKSGK